MATVINNQVILEEEYDENYEPTEEGMILNNNYPKRLSLDINSKRLKSKVAYSH